MVCVTAKWFGLVVVVAALVGASGCSDDDSADPNGGGNGASGASGGSGGGGASTGAGGSGASTPVPPPEVTKFDILGAGADGALHDELCAAHELEPGCDICEPLGFYGDLECDQSSIDAGLCVGPDPDCTPAAADYYVATDGDDNNDGSESAPFATVQKAHDVAQPGDLIYLRGGTYQPSAQTAFSSAGTDSEPIILRSYPGELPVIDGSNLPEGDVEHASTPTWLFDGSKHWQLRGPLRLINGRGAGVFIEEGTEDIGFYFVESSYNGRTASRGGHGFMVYGDAKRIRFVNCDAHHNANHRIKPTDDPADDLYQHGDGWRIMGGEDVQFIGCRATHNLDDNWDLTQATKPALLYQCWSAFAGRDDAQGSNTGTPGFEAAWGEGIKLTYDDHHVAHSCVRCLSWKNVHLGYRFTGGPITLENCASYANGRRAFGWDPGSDPHELYNCLDLDTLKDSTMSDQMTSSHNSWDADSTFSVSADDFENLDDAALLGPRSSDGSLPVVGFMRPVTDSDLIDAGVVASGPYADNAPDIGCFERW